VVYDFTGSAIVNTGEGAATVVETQKTDFREQTNYTGVLPPGGSGSPGWEVAGSTSYAPAIKRNRYGRTSSIEVVNIGSQSTTVSVYYYDDNGIQRLGGSSVLGSNGKATFTPGGSGAGGCNADNTICSARIVSSSGAALASVVREYNTSGGLSVTTHNIFSSGASPIYFPSIKYQRYNMTTGLRIQNVGSISANIEVYFYNQSGDIVCSVPAFGVPSMSARTVSPSCAGSNFIGSAVASSTNGQPLVGQANEANDSGESRKKSYSSFQGGSHVAYGPLVYHNPTFRTYF
jgi:hypothetical protein